MFDVPWEAEEVTCRWSNRWTMLVSARIFPMMNRAKWLRMIVNDWINWQYQRDGSKVLCKEWCKCAPVNTAYRTYQWWVIPSKEYSRRPSRSSGSRYVINNTYLKYWCPDELHHPLSADNTKSYRKGLSVINKSLAYYDN